MKKVFSWLLFFTITISTILFVDHRARSEAGSEMYQKGIIEGQEMYEAGEVILDSITNVPTHIRVKRACGIPDHITWSEVHKSRRWRRKVAEKCKQYGIRVEAMHR